MAEASNYIVTGVFVSSGGRDANIFFDVREVDGTVTEDHYGVELASEEEAIKQANTTLADMAREEIRRSVDFEIRIRTKDAVGNEICCRRASASTGDFG